MTPLGAQAGQLSWELGAFCVLVVALAAGFAWYERGRPSPKLVALVGTLAALAAIGRVAFAAVPNVKPTTDIVLISGFALGGAPGFAVGALAALASNFVLGQGYWTPWQMFAWGAVGVGGAALARLTRGRAGRLGLTVACALAGVAFGVVMNVSTWTLEGEQTLASFLAIAATAAPFDAAHVVGNVAFCLAFGPALLRALQRFRSRLDVRWRAVPPRAAGAGVGALLALTVALAAAPVAAAATPAQYLARSQNSDGGFGPAPGQRSTALHTGWAALGLAAAGRHPDEVRAGGRSVLDYVRAHAGEITDVGEVERTILVLAAAGASPRLGDRDLVAEVRRRQRPSGTVAGYVSYTSFGILAFRATGSAPRARHVRMAAAWLARQQNRDGGFNVGRRGGASGIDDTGYAVQALAAAGRRRSRTVRRAVAFLRRQQNADGGFPLAVNGRSNAQSTAYAVQALLAAGHDPDRTRKGGNSPLRYLRSLTTENGAVRYSRTSAQTPVWVTAQALLALNRKTFPLNPVRRRGSSQGKAGASRGGRRGPTAGGKRSPGRSASAPGGRGVRPGTPSPPAAQHLEALEPQAAQVGALAGYLTSMLP